MAEQTFLVPILDRWLLHAPLHDVTALVNGAAAARLRSGAPADDETLAALQELLASPSETEPRPIEGELVPSFLGIIPTRGCNIGCAYCNFGGPTSDGTRMDPGIAVAAVDWMAERVLRSGGETLSIQFFGGEPFVVPEVVDVVVHRARMAAAERGLVPAIEATTNGVFDEERCRFVGDYFTSVVLSFDGPPELHNRNRPGKGGRPTYEIVERTAHLLSESPIELCLRLCVTHESVERLEEITAWMCETFRPATIDFETLTPGPVPSRAGLRAPDPYVFARHCLGAFRAAESRGVDATCSTVGLGELRLTSCPVGTDAFIVSPDGRASACYLLQEDWQSRRLDLDVGRVYPDGRVDVDADALERVRHLPLDKPRCADCFCRFSCAGGCHVNQTFPGCDPAYTDFCIQTRLVTAGLLLRKLGQDDLVDELLADRGALRRLPGGIPEKPALHPGNGDEPQAAWQTFAEASFEPECLTVYLSNACNLRCSYCYADPGHGDRRTGAVDLAAVRIAADEVARHCARKGKPFHLVLHGGGEPTLHWQLLQDVVAATRESARTHDVSYHSYIATNATLGEERARWLGETFDWVGLSCDGPPDVQDAQRPLAGGKPTSALVERTARILAGVTELTVRVTVTPESVERQAEIVSYVHGELGATDVRLEPVYRRGTAGFQPADAPLFVRCYRAAQHRAETLGCRLSLAGSRPDEVHGPFCNILRDVLQLTPGGELTSCFLATGDGSGQNGGPVIGYVDRAAGRLVFDHELITALRRRATSIPERCRGCEIVHHCARDCPDVCLLAEWGSGARQKAGFRCRVQRALAEA